MNRFHLLSMDEEETSSPVAPAPAVPAPANASASHGEAKKVARKEPGSGRNDRKSRSAPRKDGEKHRTVGRGSWGRPTDGALSASTETVEDAAVVEEEEEEEKKKKDEKESENVAQAPPKPTYKTVNQYLEERAEQQRRLAARGTVSVRAANEGVDIDNDLQVLRREPEVLIVGAKKAPSSTAASNAASKEAGKSRLSLQDLNKILPPPASSTPSRERSGRDSERSPRGSRPQHRLRESQDGDNRRRSEHRASGPKQARDGVKPARIDLSDSKAFPSLA